LRVKTIFQAETEKGDEKRRKARGGGPGGMGGEANRKSCNGSNSSFCGRLRRSKTWGSGQKVSDRRMGVSKKRDGHTQKGDE